MEGFVKSFANEVQSKINSLFKPNLFKKKNTPVTVTRKNANLPKMNNTSVTKRNTSKQNNNSNNSINHGPEPGSLRNVELRFESLSSESMNGGRRKRTHKQKRKTRKQRK